MSLGDNLPESECLLVNSLSCELKGICGPMEYKKTQEKQSAGIAK